MARCFLRALKHVPSEASSTHPSPLTRLRVPPVQVHLSPLFSLVSLGGLAWQAAVLPVYTSMMWNQWSLLLLLLAAPVAALMLAAICVRSVPRWLLAVVVWSYLAWCLAVTPVLFEGVRVHRSDLHPDRFLGPAGLLVGFQMNMFVFIGLVWGAGQGGPEAKHGGLLYGTPSGEGASAEEKEEEKRNSLSAARHTEVVNVLEDSLDSAGFFSVCLLDGLPESTYTAALFSWSRSLFFLCPAL